MSNLFKQVQKKGKPPVPAFPLNANKQKHPEEEEEEENDEEEEKDTIEEEQVKGMKPLKPQNIQQSTGKQNIKSTGYQPEHWSNYFDKLEYLQDGTSVYIAGTQAPAFIFLHGAGYSGLSFACLAKEIKKFGTLITFDFRGHGHSKKECDVTDLQAETLINDTFEVFEQLLAIYPEHMFIVGGHSMGGSIATQVTHKALSQQAFKDRIQGLIVIDVVEGTAIEALPFMENIVLSRPQVFKNVEDAIKWNVRSGTIRNLASAKVSVPPQIVEKKNEQNEITGYQWKVDLLQSQKHWIGWFKGLTQTFLGIQIPKILVLAGSDRMDTELTIAQMQGKFRLTVLYDVGHAVHEDSPISMAKTCYMLLEKFKLPITVKELETLRQIGIGKFKPNLISYDTSN